MVENIDFSHFSNAGNLQHYLGLLASQIPNMPFDHLHKLCERQEKTVLSKIQEIKEIDLYDEIALINPSLNLRNLSIEEVSKKISYLKPEPHVQQRDQEEYEEILTQKSEYGGAGSNELKNILEEEDGGNAWWGSSGFEFHWYTDVMFIESIAIPSSFIILPLSKNAPAFPK